MPIDLQKVGQYLREAREGQGLTLSDVSNSLCLRRTLINAMETGDWSSLPHEVYVKGYLKEYAQLLNVYNIISPDLTEAPAIKVLVEKPIQQTSVVRQRSFPKKAVGYPLLFLCVIVVLVVSQTFMNTKRQVSSSAPNVPIQKTEHKQTGIVRTSVATADGQAANQAVPSFEMKKLMITCHERTWVSVVIDGSEKKEFMLNPEEMVILNAKDNYDLLIGNAAGVKLILNGNDIDFSGQSGEVKRIKLS